MGVAQAPVGTSVDNYHGRPAIQVTFSKDEDTVAMCSGSAVSFSNLAVEQFGSTPRVNTFAAELPLDYIWETDL